MRFLREKRFLLYVLLISIMAGLLFVISCSAAQTPPETQIPIIETEPDVPEDECNP